MTDNAEFDERQDRVVKSLDERSPRLAGVYRLALRTLHSKPDMGCEAARVSVICHCMRELMANLPAIMVEEIIERPNPSSMALTGQLPGLLAKHPDLDLTLDQDIVPVPRKVAQVFASLVAAATQEAGRNTRNAAALLARAADSKPPAVQQWKTAYDFFVGWAHLDRSHERHRELPSNEEIAASARIVEDVIEVRTAMFFEILHAVQDLLAEINATSEDGV